MKGLKLFVPLAMLIILVWIGTGCSNPDNVTYPDVPNVTDQPTDLDPDIPPSFLIPEDEGSGFGTILDMAFEKDGDMAISASPGILLFDTFAQFKRNISDGSSGWDGLVDVGPGLLDSGRGIIATGIPSLCNWTSFYDDQYVTGGVFFSSAAGWFWDGEADTLDGCNPFPASGVFGCDQYFPRGIDLHPIYGWLFEKIANPQVTADTDCELDPNPIPESPPMGGGIMAMHPKAPQNGIDPNHYEGTADFVIYHDKNDADAVYGYYYPMCTSAVKIYCWDETMG